MIDGIYGAICGDIVGSLYEWDNIKTKDFEFFDENSFFTDDTVMTIAVGWALAIDKSDYVRLNDTAIGAMCLLGGALSTRGIRFKFRPMASFKQSGTV